MTPLEAFNEAINIYGSQEKMAENLGVYQVKVSRRLSSSKNVPAEWVLKIERDTGVSRFDLRPDIYPRPQNISGEWMDENGNLNPCLDRDINDEIKGAAA